MAPTSTEHDLVIQVLRQPTCIRGWSPRQFEELFRQALRADLMARLAVMFDEQGLMRDVHPAFASHLQGALTVLQSHRAETLREVEYIRRVVAPLGVPLILLKGAAYVAAGLPAAKGRLFADVDILVPKARLNEVEGALMAAGWMTTHHSAYDQRYYREWMHELPPLVHLRRGSSLDVHHAIVPETGRWRTAPGPLFEQAVALPGSRGLSILAPADMVLHSMVHLLLNDDMSHGLRDVSDIDLLLRHFATEADFWPGLLQRATQLGLQRALHHGLWALDEVLATPIPAAVQAAVADWGPPGPLAQVLRWSWRRALCSPYATADDAGTPLAMGLIYLRAHAMRMPPFMLVRHLLIKALRLHQPPEASAA